MVQNYKQFKILSVKLFYKQFGILFRWVKLIIKKDTKHDIRAYDIAVIWYTNKEFGKHFVDYLGPTMFNIIECKKRYTE